MNNRNFGERIKDHQDVNCKGAAELNQLSGVLSSFGVIMICVISCLVFAIKFYLQKKNQNHALI